MKDGSDGFLSRWAKRKAEAKTPTPAPDAPATAGAADGIVDAEPAFDVATLPPVESLTEHSDLTAFMQKGVPPQLKQDALQKMWMTDPAIRDYIGPSEMSWDFNAAEAFHGYGALSPLAKVADMVRDIALGPAPVAGPEVAAPTAAEQDESIALPAEAPEQPPEALMDAAAQHQPEVIQNETDTGARPAKRRHGSAIPR